MDAKTLENTMKKADQDAEKIRLLEETVKRQGRELRRYINAERVMVAAGIVSEEKARQAHDIVQDLD